MKQTLLCCAALLMSLITIAQWKAIGNRGFTPTVNKLFTTLALGPDGTPYVAYSEGNYGKASVMKYDGRAWVNVGKPGLSGGKAHWIDMVISADGTPYVSFGDFNRYGTAAAATVKKYNGTSWVTVGDTWLSENNATYTSLAFSPDSTLYVAFADGKATVKKFDGTTWINVGPKQFTTGSVAYTKLAFSPDGTPYLAFEDWTNGGKASVMKYDGTTWIPVGQQGFSVGQANDISLAVSRDGTPYIAYQDLLPFSRATVMKYDGMAWVNVGAPASSTGYDQYTRIAFNGDNVLYLAYENSDTAGHVLVKKYDGKSWVIVGDTAITTTGCPWVNLAFSKSGTPHIAFSDGSYDLKPTAMAFYTLDADSSLKDTVATGAPLAVSFTAQGYYSNNNSFIAQLSDSSGNFDNALNIGTTHSTTSDTIHALIPYDTLTTTGYRIRVIATSPSYTGGDNGHDLTIVAARNRFYLDKDGDGYGNSHSSMEAYLQPAGYVRDSTDCNDTNAAINPATVWVMDADGDGYYTGKPVTQCAKPGAGYVIKTSQQPDDCDDSRATVYPGAPELCDGLDNNCNGKLDEGFTKYNFYRDGDGDGYGDANTLLKACALPPGYTKNNKDCNDADAAVHPGAAEICGNGIDDDCDGQVDEGCTLPAITIHDITVTEGNSSSHQVSFSVTLSKVSVQTTTVNFTTANGTATAPSDYIAKKGIVTFTPGVKKRTISITVKGDTLVESDESFKMVLSNAVNGSINRNIAIGTIVNDDGSALLAKSNITAASMAVSPNPANSILQIQLKGYRRVVRLQLQDLAGKVLREKKLNADNGKWVQQQFSVYDIANGTYFIVAVDEYGYRQSQKVLIIH